jgi:uncharacterized protein
MVQYSLKRQSDQPRKGAIMPKDWDCSEISTETSLNGIAHATVSEVRACLRDELPVDFLDSQGNTPLLSAVQEGASHGVIKALLEKGVDLRAFNKSGETAVMAAASRGRDKLVALLLERGADPNTRDRSGMTALMMASSWGYSKVVRVLARGGAAWDFPNQDGWTALTFAQDLGHADVIKILEKTANGLPSSTRFNSNAQPAEAAQAA